jgi:adenylate cyclase
MAIAAPPPSPPDEQEVRRPISWKIFGIAVALLVLMIVVTLLTSVNMRRVGQQLGLLSDTYIVLDQTLGDVRAFGLREIILMERVARLHPPLAREAGEREAAERFKEAGDCHSDTLRPVLKKLRDAHPDRGEQQLLSYRLTRLCTDARLAHAAALADQALRLDQVRLDADEVARFSRIRSDLENIKPARLRLHDDFEEALEQAGSKDEAVHALLQERLDESRVDASRRITAITNLLHAGTRESADRTERMELRTQWLSWSITAVACALGVLFAAMITRNLVRPMRELLTVTRSVRTGNLDVHVQIRTADEIGQLADSFNHMVGELKQKEAIKATFGKYVDPRVVQEILGQGQVALAGARQRMSVFFSDLEGFTAFCEGLTPSGAVKLLNQYFSLMAEPIHARQGIIDKYIGDSVMAFWGPPFAPAAEQAALACLAALEQQARIPGFQAMLPELLGVRRNLPAIRVRMGIATGDVTVGSIGSESSRSYTVIGDTVNLASRLESVNSQYGTRLLVDGETRTLAGEAVETREIDLIRVVGKLEPVRIFELLGPRGDVPARVAELRDLFERGLAEYRAQRWGEARATFERCLALDPEDGPSRLFIQRIGRLESQPPPPGWDGTLTLTEK